MNMKKFSICMLIFICFLGICMSSCSGEHIKYPEGKDTVMSFGDGSFQIVRSMYNNKILVFFSEKYQSNIIRDVEHTQELEGKAYITGSSGIVYVSDDASVEHSYSYQLYVVVNTTENTMQLCAIPLDASAPEIYISHLDEMMKDGSAVVYAGLEDFSEEDRLIFEEMLQQD